VKCVFTKGKKSGMNSSKFNTELLKREFFEIDFVLGKNKNKWDGLR
jgi:hypothetical protein